MDQHRVANEFRDSRQGFLDIEISAAGVDESQTGDSKMVQRENKKN